MTFMEDDALGPAAGDAAAKPALRPPAGWPQDAQAGKSCFVWREVKVGSWQPRSNLNLIDESTGRYGVLERKLAQ
jgi:hypothetical protein